jgi:hypothetical protein
MGKSGSLCRSGKSESYKIQLGFALSFFFEDNFLERHTSYHLSCPVLLVVESTICLCLERYTPFTFTFTFFSLVLSVFIRLEASSFCKCGSIPKFPTCLLFDFLLEKRLTVLSPLVVLVVIKFVVIYLYVS